jgi:hypothetical protein
VLILENVEVRTRTPPLRQGQLHPGSSIAQKRTKVEGKCLVSREPTWIGQSVRVSPPRPIHLGSFLSVQRVAEKKCLLRNCPEEGSSRKPRVPKAMRRKGRSYHVPRPFLLLAYLRLFVVLLLLLLLIFLIFLIFHAATRHSSEHQP